MSRYFETYLTSALAAWGLGETGTEGVNHATHDGTDI
jgi:hypothetical protein